MDRDLRLLIVEDSEDDAELISLELRRSGLATVWRRVDNERDFRQALGTERWDMVLSDFQMPEFNGLRAFGIFQELGLDIPFLFVSGAIGEDRAVEAMRAGARDYILKGNLTRLHAAVVRELGAAKVREAQRSAEAAAKDESRRLQMAVDASGAGILEYRLPAPGVVYLGPRWAKILGFEPDELPGPAETLAWFFERMHPDDRAPVEMDYAAFREGRSVNYRAEYRVLRKDCAWLDVAEFAQAVERDASGAVTHVVSVILDMSDRRRLEAEFRQAQKMEAVGRLAGGVAHDFNNVLTAIFSFGQCVLDNLSTTDPRREDMEEVLKAASRAESLTAQLLAFSRRRPMSLKVVDLNHTVREIERMLERIVGEDVELSTRLGDRLGSVRVDPSAIEQVLVNLAVNARDAMPQGGRLTVTTASARFDEAPEGAIGVWTPGDYVTLVFSDTGEGMDEATRSQIFEPFFTTKGPGEGTGLGLSTCYGIVQQAGGQIAVASRVGEGTTFTIYLPRADDPPDMVARGRDLVAAGGSETILVVEDDEQVRRVAVRILSSRGYHVLDAPDGETALARHVDSAVPIALLMTDVVMPGMSGKQLAEQFLAKRPGVRVLFTSGYTPNAIVDRGVVERDANVLAKPFTPQVLTTTVRKILDQED